MLVNWGMLNTGLQEEAFYFKSALKQVPNFNGLQANILRRATSINYRSRSGAWPGLGQGQRFAMRWLGLLVIKKAGKYRLSLGSDDGSKLYVDNRNVINNDGLHKFQWKHAGRRLVKGQQRLRLEYFNNGGKAACLFHYRGADTENKDLPVAGTALRYKMKNGFKEEVYYNLKGLKHIPSLRGKKASMQRIIPRVAYGNTAGKWKGYSQSDNFAVRWSGILQISQSGNYRWSLKSDDGSKLHLDGKLVINNDGLHGFRNVESTVRMSGTVLVHVDFFEGSGHAGMVLKYMGLDTKNRMIQIPQKAMMAAL